MNHPIIIENSKRLKRLLSPFNPLLGDPQDPGRFLLDIRGIKKVYLPVRMKETPLIKILVAKGALSKFIRSQFFKDNFHSVAHFYKTFHALRLKYDFPFWISQNFKATVDFKPYLSLLRSLEKIRWEDKSVRLIIRKNPDRDISAIINLFIIWHKEYSKHSLDVMAVYSSSKDRKINRDFFLNSQEVSTSPCFRFKKTEFTDILYSHHTDSRFRFGTVSNPDYSRGSCFSYLLLHDVHRWKNKGDENIRKVIRATFPVVPNDADSVIILTTGPYLRKSFIRDEWLAAYKGESHFKTLSLPWHEDPNKTFRFDFPKDKLEFHKNLLKYRNNRRIPHFPNVDARYLFSLWQQGLPLEVIYWYASESSYYKSQSQFLRLFPL